MEQPGAGSIGRALRDAVGIPPPERVPAVRGAESVLMSAARRRIYTTLAGRPCLHVRALARALRVAAPTVTWHLRRMIKAGFITEDRAGRRRVFYPVGFLGGEDVPLLVVANNETPSRILETVRKTPGLSLQELEKAHGGASLARPLRALAKCGALGIVADGRFRRFYLAERFEERDRESRKRGRQFQRDLLRRLQRDGLAPRVVRAREGELELEVREGARAVPMVIPLRPFARFVRRS